MLHRLVLAAAEDGSGGRFWLDSLWHPLRGLGYQFWSGVGGAVQAAVEKALYAAGFVALWWRHHNCIERGCWRTGHPHPERAGHPVCRRHVEHPHPAFG